MNEVHPLIDAQITMRILCGEEYYFSDDEFGKRWTIRDFRNIYPGKLYINFLSLYENKAIFLIGRQAKHYFSSLFDLKKIKYEIIDYDSTIQFRVDMTPEQIVEFNGEFINMLKMIER